MPDAANCAGCETGDLAAGSPLEHCCADSCPSCSRAPSRCVPPDVYYGDPLATDPERREAVKAYLAQKDKHVPPELQRWRTMVGKPKALGGKGGGGSGARGKGGGQPAKASKAAAKRPPKSS